MMNTTQWPKILLPLTSEQQIISDDFMHKWHEELSKKSRYKIIENFNQNYPVTHAQKKFLRTLEIGAGLGEHLKYEKLNEEQKKNYFALELRENMATEIKKRYPDINVFVGDCQKSLPFKNNYFDRLIAIHVLEHLPNLPATIQEMHRLCQKNNGRFFVVIPCEGGLAYSCARSLSAQRKFERMYKQSYKWFIEREHINRPEEILNELKQYFQIEHQSFFPLFIPSIHLNLVIGLTLKPIGL